jgi:hypothetical protein
MTDLLQVVPAAKRIGGAAHDDVASECLLAYVGGCAFGNWRCSALHPAF